MSKMIKPCIVNYVILLIMISLAFMAKADHDDDPNKGDLLGVFIFGDSEVDAGNNNYFFTLAKGNNRPDGIDFKPSGGNPTGRYTNGRTPPDIIGEELGQPNYAVPFLAPSSHGEAILPGVNYASGGAGILNSTGKIFINVVGMDIQVDYFNITRQQLDELLGPTRAKQFIMKQSIFSVSIGSNDFLCNYLLPVFSSAERILVSPDDFIADMIKHLRDQLTRLYQLDARKFMVTNIGPIGCIPYQRKMNSGHCADFSNKLAIQYNERLKDLLDELNESLKGAIFVYANVYDLAMDIITNYDKYGFKTASEPCHEGGKLDGIVPQGLISTICSDRSAYVFWDIFHFTEAANLIVSKQLIDGDTKYISPINIRKLRDL